MNNLKKLRLEKNLTVEQVSKLVGIPRSTLTLYENNKRQPRKKIWEKLADYFGVDVAYLMGISDIPHIEEALKQLDIKDVKRIPQTQAIVNLIDTLNEDGLNAAVQQLTLLTKITEFRRK